MINSLMDLEKILAIANPDVRLSALKNAAMDLGVLDELHQGHEKTINEQQLVLAIYDGLVARGKDAQKTRRFIILTAAGFLAAMLIIIVAPHAIVRYVRYIRARYHDRSPVYKGFEEDGSLVKDDKGQPVLFRDMEGYYDEFYDDGKIHFQYLYSAGKIIEQTEYDRKGRVIAHFLYDPDGNPVLTEEP